MQITTETTRTTTHGPAAAAVIHLAGDFDVRSTWEVRTAIYEALATAGGRAGGHTGGHAGGHVVVDLSEVGAVDLTALRLLAVATRQAGRDGHRLTLRGCGPAVRRMLHLSRLIRVVEVERSAVSA